MNRIQQLFRQKKNILSVYFSAGYPSLNDTPALITALADAGADMIEIGIPFSDPLADGPVIQHTSEVALKNGMSVKNLFQQLRTYSPFRPKDVPLLLMGYLNPVLQYGPENFCREAKACGIDGIILPDLPLQEYLDHYQELFDKYGLLNIFLVTPQTSEQRIRLVDSHSKGFIYLVSSASTTGVKEGISADQESYFKRMKEMKLQNPLLIGFGISDAGAFEKACSYANGAIVGSAFVKAVSDSGRIKEDVKSFITGMRISTTKNKMTL
ncbi:MAG TPA: tryptophan synthase subunit alpha [Bacteroidia bacterium]|jgi:tryptophan synthase alpha chain|nr:tryptophan synthase subunit alpha [Bacteroidia bacterium]